MDIPIIVISYNNYKYVENTLRQIKQINPEYYKNITILDNCSTCSDTIQFLQNVDVNVIRRNGNYGPRISHADNVDIYNQLPSKFILTDPDLEFNNNLPQNFIDILSQLSDKYKIFKIGFALDISDFDKMFPYSDYNANRSIFDWESQFWCNKIEDNPYQLYKAGIDTTFCLINKNYSNVYDIYDGMRVAGNFTAKHLPWYTDNKIYNIYEIYHHNIQQTNISSIKHIISRYISEFFVNVHQNDEFFFIPKHQNPNIDEVWQNDDTTIHKYLNKNKVFIDIGAKNGTTALYASRKSKHIYCVETNKRLFNDLSENLKNNCKNNYTLINEANYDIIDNCNQISLIKVDIDGSEEKILERLHSVHMQHNVPLYVKFRYDLWNDKNLDRFHFLTENQKTSIRSNPSASILFDTDVT